MLEIVCEYWDLSSQTSTYVTASPLNSFMLFLYSYVALLFLYSQHRNLDSGHFYLSLMYVLITLIFPLSFVWNTLYFHFHLFLEILLDSRKLLLYKSCLFLIHVPNIFWMFTLMSCNRLINDGHGYFTKCQISNLLYLCVCVVYTNIKHSICCFILNNFSWFFSLVFLQMSLSLMSVTPTITQIANFYSQNQ